MKLNGRVALVAGNLGKLKKDKFIIGLGGLIAKDLADEGAKVIIIDLNNEIAEACAKNLANENIKAKSCDLLKNRISEEKKFINDRGDEKTEIIWTDSPAHTLVNEIVEEFGKLDVLVTNFDTFKKGKLETFLDEDYQTMYNNDIKTVFHLLAAVRNLMSAQKKKTGEFGNIVLLTNMAGKAGLSTATVYSGIKGAIVHGIKTIAREFGRFANVNAIAMAPLDIKKMQGPPDRIKKQFFLTQCPMGSMGIIPKHVVPMVRLLASNEGEGLCGQAISIDGGLWLHEGI